MDRKNCNTVDTKGCAKDNSYGDVKASQNELLTIFDKIKVTLDNFDDTLSVFCEDEQANLTSIFNKMSEVVLLNEECCSTVNGKLNELINVILEIENCDDYCDIEGFIECEEIPTTTTLPTTTVEGTTTVIPTTTVEGT